MSSWIYVRLGGWVLLQGEYLICKELKGDQVGHEMFDGSIVERPQVSGYGIADEDGNNIFSFPFGNPFDDRPYISNLIGAFHQFHDKIGGKVSAFELINGIVKTVVTIKDIEDNRYRWFSHDYDSETNDVYIFEKELYPLGEPLFISGFGLIRTTGQELLSYSMEKALDEDPSNYENSLFSNSVCAFNLFCKNAINGRLSKLEIVDDKTNIRKIAALKEINDDYILWITYNGDSETLDYLCEIGKECLISDHSDKLAKFKENCNCGCSCEKNEDLSKRIYDPTCICAIEKDLMYIFEDYLMNYTTQVEVLLFN